MRKIIFIIIFIIILIFSILYVSLLTLPSFAQHQHQRQGPKEDTALSQKKIKYWTCGMHPQIKQDKPGNCPICNMKLIPVYEEQEEVTQEAAGESFVKISENQQQLIGVKTEPITTRQLMQMIRTVAKIAYDPELYKTEQEFIQAYRTQEATKSGLIPEVIQRSYALVEAASLKLKLLGLSDEQIEELKTKTESDRGLLISDNASPYVWAYLTIYEYDLDSIKVGDHVVLKAISYPGEEFSGKIVSIDPVLDVNTRSVRARVQIDNPQAKLKPNMYADAFIHIDLGGELAVPKEAVLDTGIRKIVYVDLGKGQFKAKEVEVGPEAIALVDGQERNFFPVIKGLSENDIVVTKGNFLIDSQSQLTGGMSALWGGATEIRQEEQPQEKEEIKTQHKH